MFDEHFRKHYDASLYYVTFPSNKSLQFIKEQYELVGRCKYRAQLSETILNYRKEYLFNLVVESAKLFEAILKSCIIAFNPHSDGRRINKNYVEKDDMAKESTPTKNKDVQETIKGLRGRDYVEYAKSSQEDFIAKNCESPALNDYIFEVLYSLGDKVSLDFLDWRNGVRLTFKREFGVLDYSCNIRSLLCAIALTAYVYPDHPFRSLWVSEKHGGLKLLISEAYAVYVLRNQSGGAHFVPNDLDKEYVLERVNKVLALADTVMEEVLINI